MGNRIVSTDEVKELALLWLRSQDLSGVSPEELLDMCSDAYQKISDHKRQQAQARVNRLTLPVATSCKAV